MLPLRLHERYDNGKGQTHSYLAFEADWGTFDRGDQGSNEPAHVDWAPPRLQMVLLASCQLSWELLDSPVARRALLFLDAFVDPLTRQVVVHRQAYLGWKDGLAP